MDNTERKDFELYVLSTDGTQFQSGQPFGAGMRTMMHVVNAYVERCKDEKRSYMLRLFGPHADRKWGFICAFIIDANGEVTERMDVTVPEPFFSGKLPTEGN